MLDFCKEQDKMARRLMELYLCDPNKNAKCKKTICGSRCIATTEKKHAKRVNGKAVKLADDIRGIEQIKSFLTASLDYHVKRLKEYKALNGNGSVEKLIADIKKLEIK